MSDAVAVLDNDATRSLRKPSGDAGQRSRTSDDSQLERHSSDARGQRLLSYELGELIGAGGMGEVHKATHLWLGRTVAIKFISSRVLHDSEAISRFMHEARAIGSLDHPNIVRATDAGRVNEVCFLVTEFIDGKDLTQLVESRGPLRAADACEIVRQAALGLDHAHEHGLVHRDIKPSNLIVDLSGTVKLLDFGLARVVAGQTTFTSTGQMIGTLDFLAPEQAGDARNVDIRADIYSLGCTLYFLLTGESPFSGPMYNTPASKLKAHLADEVRLPESLRDALPSGVRQCLERMLAKDPGERYQTPAQLAIALEPHTHGAAIVALMSKNWRTIPRKSQRNRGVLRTVFAGIVAMVTFLPRTLFKLLRLRRRRDYLSANVVYRSRRHPLLSLLGIAAVALAGFMLMPLSCVPIQTPPGMPHGEFYQVEFGPEPFVPVGSHRAAPPESPFDRVRHWFGAGPQVKDNPHVEQP